jgi:hypothetical protein
MGGIQTLLVGDYYQLSPVPNMQYNDRGIRSFEHPSFRRIVSHTIVLAEVVFFIVITNFT